MLHKPVMSKSKIVVLCLICVLVSSFITYSIASSPSTTFHIDSGPYAGAPSYTVYSVSGTYYAKDQNGYNEFSGTNAATVINNALNGLTAGRTWKKTVLLQGDLGEVHDINVPSYTLIKGEDAKLTLPADQNYIFLLNGVTDVEFRNLKLIATRSGRSVLAQAIRSVVGASTNIIVDSVTIEDFYYTTSVTAGIFGVFQNLRVSKSNFINGGNGTEYAYPIYLGTGTDDVVIESSRIINPQAGNHILVYGASNIRVVNNYLDGVNSDSTIEGICFSAVTQGQILGNDVLNTGAAGILIHGSTALGGGCKDIIISSNNIQRSLLAGNARGIFIWSENGEFSDRVLISDNTIYNCTSGIVLGRITENEAHKVQINGNWIAQISYPVYAYGNAYNIRMMFNTFRDVVTGCGFGAGGTLYAKFNEGFVTENSVTATNTTTTTFVFNHGLTSTATFVWCSFSTSAITGYTWTSTTSQVTVTVTGTLPSSWTTYAKVEYQP